MAVIISSAMKLSGIVRKTLLLNYISSVILGKSGAWALKQEHWTGMVFNIPAGQNSMILKQSIPFGALKQLLISALSDSILKNLFF